MYGIGSVNLQRSIPIQDGGGEGHVELDGKASGMGFNAGVYFAPTDKLSVGVTYRSKVEMKVEDGDATFMTTPAGPVASRFPNTQFDATLPLVANISIGVGYKATDKLLLAFDVQRANWSAYKSLRFDYAATINGSTFSESARNYEDSYAFRLGAQYQAIDKLTLRAGVYFDQSPVQDGYLTPETPDSDAIGTSVGLTYDISDKFGIDASFLYVNRKKRTDTADLSGGVPGTFKSVGYIPGIALSYKF